MKNTILLFILSSLLLSFDEPEESTPQLNMHRSYDNSSWWTRHAHQHDSIVFNLVNIAQSTADLESSELRTETTALVQELQDIREKVEIRRLEWERVSHIKLEKVRHNIEDWKNIRNRKREVSEQILNMDNVEIRQKYVDVSERSLEIAREFHFSEEWNESRLSLEFASTALDFAMSIAPGFGWGKDLYEVVYGINLITGESLSSSDYFFSVIGVFTGGVGSKIKAAPKVIKSISKIIHSHGDLINSAENLYILFEKNKLSDKAILCLKTASEINRSGASNLGHKFQKHSGRKPEIWGTIRGTADTWHEQGMKHFKEILDSPGSFETVLSGRISFLEKRIPDGRGVRLNMDGSFKTFID